MTSNSRIIKELSRKKNVRCKKFPEVKKFYFILRNAGKIYYEKRI